jgi:uncharacterized protein
MHRRELDFMAAPDTLSIALDRHTLSAFCDRWGVAELALFGSVVRDDFGPDSDVDVLVSFGHGVRRGLFDLAQMELELEAIFGRKVDLVTRRSIEQSHNWIRRTQILTSAVPLDLSTHRTSAPAYAKP